MIQLTRLYSISGSFTAGLALGFYLTYGYYTEKIERIYTQIEVEAKEHDLRQYEKQRTDENFLLSLQNSQEKQTLNAFKDIQAQFNNLSLIDTSFTDSADRVQHQDRDSDNPTALSGSSGTACKTAAGSSCERLRKAYNNLKGQCAELVRERDELSVERNELIQIYNKVRKLYDNLDKAGN